MKCFNNLFFLAISTLGVVSAISSSALASRQDYEAAFYNHINKYSVKIANGAEFVQRLEVFISNMQFIQQHNNKADQSYRLAPNQFAHLTLKEFHAAAHLNSMNSSKNRASVSQNSTVSGPIPPLSVDWVTAGGVTSVKDQGKCGSGWAFSAVGALEGAYYRKYGKLLTFSTQQVVSCDNHSGDDETEDHGCNGGTMNNAFTFVGSYKGIALDSDYPYTSGVTGESGVCNTGINNVADAAPLSYSTVIYGNTYALMQAVAYQPVSIAVDANNQAFQFYAGGVLSAGCTWDLNHGVLLVGYGNDNGVDYWKVKNSWGTSWGEDGYIRIKKSTEDLCGVLDAGSYPNLGVN